MTIIIAIHGAVVTALQQGEHRGAITPESAWQDIRAYLREHVPANRDWPKSLVEAQIVLTAMDARPIGRTYWTPVRG